MVVFCLCGCCSYCVTVVVIVIIIGLRKYLIWSVIAEILLLFIDDEVVIVVVDPRNIPLRSGQIGSAINKIFLFSLV